MGDTSPRRQLVTAAPGQAAAASRAGRRSAAVTALPANGTSAASRTHRAAPVSHAAGTPMDSRRVEASGPRAWAMPRQVPYAARYPVRRSEKENLAKRHGGGTQAEQRDHVSERDNGQSRGDDDKPSRHQEERPPRAAPQVALAGDRHDSRYCEKPARFRRAKAAGGNRQRKRGDREVPGEGDPCADTEHHQQAAIPPRSSGVARGGRPFARRPAAMAP
jgi:hypothetical protein